MVVSDSEKTTKPQDRPHVWAKFLRKNVRQDAQRYRKMTLQRRELQEGMVTCKGGKSGKGLKNVHLWPDFPGPHRPVVHARSHRQYEPPFHMHHRPVANPLQSQDSLKTSLRFPLFL